MSDAPSNSVDDATVAREFLTTPVQVIIGGSDSKLVANKDVTQIIHRCSATEKEDKLVELLTGLDADASIIILCAATLLHPQTACAPDELCTEQLCQFIACQLIACGCGRVCCPAPAPTRRVMWTT